MQHWGQELGRRHRHPARDHHRPEDCCQPRQVAVSGFLADDICHQVPELFCKYSKFYKHLATTNDNCILYNGYRIRQKKNEIQC